MSRWQKLAWLLTASQIALGTVILLLGVLALSWRLNNDPATRPPVSQNPLTPAMGFVDDDSDSEAETDTAGSNIDEEAAHGKTSPFLNHRKTHRFSLPADPRTPTAKNNDLLSITRTRRPGITESEEIWDELEDDSLADLSPHSLRWDSSRSTPLLRPKSAADARDDGPTESTALLARSSTGRSYRDHRRRRSAPALDLGERERRRRSASSQEALGGWWKMKWWKGKEDKGKGVGNGNGNGNGSGNGNGNGG